MGRKPEKTEENRRKEEKHRDIFRYINDKICAFFVQNLVLFGLFVSFMTVPVVSW